MKVSDYIVKYFKKQGIHDIFGYPGGMVTYLMDSLAKESSMKSHLCYHEQGAGFAACGYAQINGGFGVAFATSGPGATNLITPICHAQFDSIPVIFITGQVNTAEARGDYQMRQKGFQETDIISIVKSITKYAVYVDNAQKIRYYLDRALFEMRDQRPGAVLLDIPIDIQRTEIDPDALIGYSPSCPEAIDYDAIQTMLIDALKTHKKPLLLVGNGIHAKNLQQACQQWAKKLNIPMVSSMPAMDMFNTQEINFFGFIGSYGLRIANFIVSQCDLLITIGTRLDNRQTGADISQFAPNADIVRFDIDKYELQHKIKPNEMQIIADIKEVLPKLSFLFPQIEYDYNQWKNQCNFYREKLTGMDDSRAQQIIRSLSDIIPEGAIITTDVGQNQVWVAQSFRVKKKQRILFSAGHGAMGVSLPNAIGASYASHRKKNIYCFCGDGGFQMNIQELQVIVRDKLPIKIILINNNSLGMIRHFQEMYFNAKFTQTVKEEGYVNPDFKRIGEAYGLRVFSNESIPILCDALLDDEPTLFEFTFEKYTYIAPKLMYNKPIYDQDPPLPRTLLKELLNYRGD